MKRLTKKIKECGRTISYVSSGDCKDVWNTPRWFVGNAIDRLSELEDILGDDYDLDRLQEIVGADREGRLKIFSPEAQAADVAPVVHGKWMAKKIDNFRKFEITCSVCGWTGIENYDSYDDPSDFNYCPNCGAKMDLEE